MAAAGGAVPSLGLLKTTPAVVETTRSVGATGASQRPLSAGYWPNSLFTSCASVCVCVRVRVVCV
jgi:hypothetical protein